MSSQSGMSLTIMTPQGCSLSAEINYIRLPGRNGEIGVITNHTPTLSLLNAGSIEIHVINKDKKKYFIPEGIAKISEKRVLVIVPYIECISTLTKIGTETLRQEALKEIAIDHLSEKDRLAAERKLIHANIKHDLYVTHNKKKI